MRLTTEECVDVVRGIDEIKVNELEVKVAFKILKIQDAVAPINKAFTRIEMSLIEECIDGELSGDGSFKLKPDKAEYFHTKKQEALSETVEVEFTPISLEELGDIKLPLETVERLKPILEE